MPTAKQRLATTKYIEATAAWSKHSTCGVCHGKIHLVINCPEGKRLAAALESASTSFRAMEAAKVGKERVKGN